MSEDLAKRLTQAQRELLPACPAETWFTASDLGVYPANTTGSVLTAMLGRGIFRRQSDPIVWGRSQYYLTPLGLAVRAHLQEQPHAD